MPCNGDSRIACGGGNGVLVYEDTNWKDPTRDELADALGDYTLKARGLRDAIQLWKDYIDQYNTQQQNTRRDIAVDGKGNLVERAIPVIITLELIAQQRAQVLALEQIAGKSFGVL
jgi:hypothetical protein